MILYVENPNESIKKTLLELINDYVKVGQYKINIQGASLVAQWLRIHLPIQGTQVQALIREDPTCRGATTEPALWSPCATTIEPAL